jgi:hypothetical protein
MYNRVEQLETYLDRVLTAVGEEWSTIELLAEIVCAVVPAGYRARVTAKAQAGVYARLWFASVDHAIDWPPHQPPAIDASRMQTAAYQPVALRPAHGLF